MSNIIACLQSCQRYIWLLGGVWLILCFLPPGTKRLAHAQTTTGTILGTVIRQDQTPLPGAIVRIFNKLNGLNRTARTDANGVYRFDLILPGLYDIRAQADGFRDNAIENFIIEVNREKIIQPPPIVLEATTAPPPSPAAPPPTTPGQPPLPTPGTTQANIADAALRGSATAEFILALPLRGIRNFDTFALLTPGVTPPSSFFGVSSPGNGPNVGGGDFVVNGIRARGNNFTIDGADNNDQDVGGRRRGYVATAPQPIESLREFQITTLLADAESGRNGGGQINVVSRTGENEFHGNLSTFFNDARLNARDAFDFRSGSVRIGKPAFTRHQSGATLGGPFQQNRWHFFTAFERIGVNRTQSTHFVAPTLTERAAALALAGPQSLLGRDLLDLYPLPNNPGGPYGDNTLTQFLAGNGAATLFSFRSDYQFNPFDRPTLFTARYNLSDDHGRLPNVGNAINSGVDSRTRTHNVAFDLTTRISDRFSNQMRLSYGRQRLGFDEIPTSPFIFQTRSIGVDLTGDGLPDGRSGPLGRVDVLPYSSIGVDPKLFPQRRVANTIQIADTFIWNHGPSTLKAGADVRFIRSNSLADINYRLTLAFGPGIVIPSATTFRYASGVDFLALGLPVNLSQTFVTNPNSTLALRTTEYNFFVNETLRLGSRVILRGGVRYELNTVPDTADEQLRRRLAVGPGDFPVAPGDQPQATPFFLALDSYRGFVNQRRGIYDSSPRNVAGRVSLAWDVSGTGRTAVRAGYGMFYDIIPLTITGQSRNLFPNAVQTNFRSGIIFPDILRSNPAILFGPTGGGNCGGRVPGISNAAGAENTPTGTDCTPRITGSLPVFLGDLFDRRNFRLSYTLPRRDMRVARVHQVSLSVEQVLADRLTATVAYVGTFGRDLIRPGTPNGGPLTPLYYLPPGPSAPFSQVQVVQRRNDSAVGAISGFSTDTESFYHALQIGVRQRFTRGLTFQAAYTWSHAIDSTSELFDTASNANRSQVELDIPNINRLERGSASFDIRHRFATGVQYDLPWSAGNPWLGGFQVSGIVTLQTGQPFTVITALDTNRDGNRTDRLATTQGLSLRRQGAQQIALAPGVDPLTLTAFSLTAPGEGVVGRNTFRAPGVALVDAALTKRFAFAERYALLLRVEAFNLFNRTHFGLPVRVLEAPAFGRAVATSAPPRQIQFALKFQF
ncbi:MAG: carboxypeptidase regulatory-like domain-containing protein [Acidobacteriota bacterium]